MSSPSLLIKLLLFVYLLSLTYHFVCWIETFIFDQIAKELWVQHKKSWVYIPALAWFFAVKHLSLQFRHVCNCKKNQWKIAKKHHCFMKWIINIWKAWLLIIKYQKPGVRLQAMFTPWEVEWFSLGSLIYIMNTSLVEMCSEKARRNGGVPVRSTGTLVEQLSQVSRAYRDTPHGTHKSLHSKV